MPSGIDGSSTREIWLQIMSFVLMGLGVSYFAQRTLVGFASLLAVAAAVFAAARLPAFKHVRVATLAVVLVAFGVALDRLGFGAAGIGELLLFLGTAAAAIGALLLELGHDQPLGRPQS